MFNNRVSRCRLTALLVLAGLVLFGLGAGHLATRALGAGGQVFARAQFTDGGAVGLQSDDGRAYVDDRLSPDGDTCVANQVNQAGNGAWHLATPNGNGCSGMATRSFKLIFGPGLTPCPVASARGGPDLDTCGSNVVWGHLQTGGLFTNQAGKFGTQFYFRTDDATATPFAFELVYPAITVKPGDTANERILTTDGVANSGAKLYKFVTNPNGQNDSILLGTYSVPLEIRVTKVP